MKKRLFTNHPKKFGALLAINQNIFRIFLVFFGLILLFEYLMPGFFTNWFNPLWVLLIVILSAIIMISND